MTKTHQLSQEYKDIDIDRAVIDFEDGDLTAPYYAGVEVTVEGKTPKGGIERRSCVVKFSFDRGELYSVDVGHKWGDGEFPNQDFIRLAVAALSFDAPSVEAALNAPAGSTRER